MYEYIKGIVTQVESNYIVLEQNGIGYMIYTGNPYSFHVNETYQVYIYQYVREDEISLYGFGSKEEKELFLRLIDVKGLGCKMALPMLATGSIDGIMNAIEHENILYLKKFPKIGDKVARQIILDLKGKLVSQVANTNVQNEELIETLKALGYKQTDIQRIVNKVDVSLKIEDQVKEALKLLLK